MIATWPRKGLCAFLGSELHPSTTLIAWLAAVLSVQFLGYAGLGVLGLAILLSTPAAVRSWLDYVRRGRWLLLMLWVILAYNTPGEAFHDFPWAPTYEGVAEANLHAVRLVLILACLAWLFNRLGRDGLLSALWGLLLPLCSLGLDIERLLVRLSLVLENLQTPPEKGAWKRMLDSQPCFAQGPSQLQLRQPAWHVLDALIIVLVGALLAGVLVV